jgi:hypothetical protein
VKGDFTDATLEKEAIDWIAQMNERVNGTYSLVRIELGQTKARFLVKFRRAIRPERTVQVKQENKTTTSARLPNETVNARWIQL